MGVPDFVSQILLATHLFVGDGTDNPPDRVHFRKVGVPDFSQQVTPGSHTITSKSENDATLTFSTEAGKNYYVWQEVKMGLLMARSKLSQVSEEEGKQGVMESKLVK